MWQFQFFFQTFFFLGVFVSFPSSNPYVFFQKTCVCFSFHIRLDWHPWIFVEVKKAVHDDVRQFGRWIGRDLRFAKNLYMHLGWKVVERRHGCMISL